jgi:Methyltransferase domain
VRFLSTAQEIAGSSYYRSRPLATLQFLYSRWEFARKRTEDPQTLLRMAGLDPMPSLDGFGGWAPILHTVVQEASRYEGQGNLNMPEGEFLFAATRALRPEVVIETGVAAGVSSCFLIAALIENGSGTLYSVDLPTDGNGQLGCADAARYDWPQKGVGWAIPAEMRTRIGDRHILILDDVRNALPRILSSVPHVDLFFHDDLHLPEHMLWEYESIWPRLRPGGILASHDVNMGWIQFCRNHNLPSQRLVNLNRLCAVRKP